MPERLLFRLAEAGVPQVRQALVGHRASRLDAQPPRYPAQPNFRAAPAERRSRDREEVWSSDSVTRARTLLSLQPGQEGRSEDRRDRPRSSHATVPAPRPRAAAGAGGAGSAGGAGPGPAGTRSVAVPALRADVPATAEHRPGQVPLRPRPQFHRGPLLLAAAGGVPEVSSLTRPGGDLGQRDGPPGNLPALTGLQDGMAGLTDADRSPRLDLPMLLLAHPGCSGSLIWVQDNSGTCSF